jgi:mRNA interferase MazF
MVKFTRKHPMGSVPAPKRGQIWLVNLDPTIGSEIKKKRPCAVIGEQLFMRPRMTIVVPITGWKSKYDECVWMVKVDKNQRSGLSKTSVVDAAQIRSISTERLVRSKGRLSTSQLDEVVAAVVLCIGYVP